MLSVIAILLNSFANCSCIFIFFIRLKFGATPRINVAYLSSYGPECGKAQFSISNSFEIQELSSSSSAAEKTHVPTPFDTQFVYTPIGTIDTMRERGEWQKHSISTIHVFCPSSSKVNHNTETTPVADSLMEINRYVYLKVKPINPAGASNNVRTNDPSASPTHLDSQASTNHYLVSKGRDVR